MPPVAVGAVRVLTGIPSISNSTRSTPAPPPPVAVVANVSGTPGVARTVPEEPGETMAIVGVPNAAVTNTALETVLLPRSSIAIRSIV